MVRTSGVKKADEIELSVRCILRDWLEYPTEDVTLAFLAAINKILVDVPAGGIVPTAEYVVTFDDFADKALKSVVMDSTGQIGRWNSVDDFYTFYLDAGATEDTRIYTISAGSATAIAGTDQGFDADTRHLCKFSISGSTLLGYLDDLTTYLLSATDTTFASGKYGTITSMTGGRDNMSGLPAMLVAPSSNGPRAKAVMEIDVTGAGTWDDPKRPNLLQDYPVTWGAFDYKGGSTMVVVILDGSDENIQAQLDNAKSKGYVALDVPDTTSYQDAVDMFNQVKKAEMIAGKDNFVFNVLGTKETELFQNADFYYGELVEHKTHYDQLKKVPDWEMWRRLDYLEDELSKVTILTEERDKHLNKVREVKKLGW